MSSVSTNAAVDVDNLSTNSSTIYSSSDGDTIDLRSILCNCIVKQKWKMLTMDGLREEIMFNGYMELWSIWKM